MEIFLNGKFYNKKEFYLHIKLKFLRINLKFDKAYIFIFMKNILSTDDESEMSLDDLCHKDLKVYLTETKENDLEDIKPKKIIQLKRGI